MTYQHFLVDGEVSPVISRHNADGSTSYIPSDTSNVDWLHYQSWLADGNTPDAA